jgi:hypothetical protein
MNELYKQFDQSIEDLCVTVVHFWKNFERVTMDVITSKKLGSKIAKGIKEVFFKF